MAVLAVGLTPHPPIAVPEVGREESERVMATRKGALELGRRVVAQNPDALVIITPHGPVFQDSVAVWGVDQLRGDLKSFGAPGVRLERKVDLDLARAIVREAGIQGVQAFLLDGPRAGRYRIALGMDHGLLVPLYFLDQAGVRLPLVAASMAILPVTSLYRFGVAVRRAAEAVGKRVVVIASGDLSHRLTPDGPAGYNPRGRDFDAQVTGALARSDLWELLNLDPDLTEAAGECGRRPLVMAIGSLEGDDVQGEVLSYEGPFGVGYAVGYLEPVSPGGSPSLLERLEADRRRGQEERKRAEDPLVRLARNSLETYIRSGKVAKPPDAIPSEWDKGAGAFVTLKIDGGLRGCIGTTGPTRQNLAVEVIHNAVAAGTEDPRFPPVGPEELDQLTYSVDVLGEPEEVDGLDKLDPSKYGVIVSHGGRSGLLLPDLPGIDSPGEQVAIAMQKAGIPAGTKGVRLRRFTVTRYH